MMNFDVLINPFGNWWQPNPPTGYRPTWPQWLRAVVWHLRNPAVNFFSAWIGFRRATKSETLAGLRWTWSNTGRMEIWRDGGGLYLAVFWPRGWPFLPLPYVSVRWRRIETYLGWQYTGQLAFSLRPANAAQAGETR